MTQTPAYENYQVVNTDHFNIYAPENLSNYLELVQNELELAYTKLWGLLGFQVDHKITIILTDHMDSSNGITTPIGHSGFILFMVRPDPYTSLNDHENWYRNLITHELNHYFTLYPTRGAFAFFESIFGPLMLPNAGWPRWLSEGLSVFAETRLTKLGRGQGPYYQAILRDIAQRQLWPSYNQLSGIVPQFPYGESPYLYGYELVHQMSLNLGELSLGRFSQLGSGRIPYFLNGTLEKTASGLQKSPSFQDLYLQTQKRISQMSSTEPKPWSSLPTESRSPERGESLGGTFSPGGRYYAYFYRSPDDLSQLRVVDTETNQTWTHTRVMGSPWFQWEDLHRNEYTTDIVPRLFLSLQESRTPFSVYGDLFVWKAGHLEQLTHEQRVRDVTVCGTDIFITTVGQAHSFLKRVQLKGSHQAPFIETLYEGTIHERLASPTCGINTNEVILSRKRDDHLFEELVVFKASSPQTLTPLLSETSRGFLHPSKRPDGKIWLTVLEKGIFQLGLFDPEDSSLSLYGFEGGGLWLPKHISEDRVLVHKIHGLGIQLLEYSIKDLPVNPQKIQITGIDLTESQPLQPQTGTSPLTHDDAHQPKLSRPAPWSAGFRPRFWLPLLSSSKVYTFLGTQTFLWDDLDRFQTNLTLGYYAGLGTPHVATKLTLRGKTLRFELGQGYLVSSATEDSSIPGTIIWVQKNHFFLEASYLQKGLFREFEPHLGLEWAHSILKENHETVLKSPAQLNLWVGYDFDSRQRATKSAEYEEGFKIQLASKRYKSFGYHESMKFFAHMDTSYTISESHLALRHGLYGALSTSPKPIISNSFVDMSNLGSSKDYNLPLRGYSSLSTKYGWVLQNEFQVPFQVFKGPGHAPLFLQNLGLFVLADWAESSQQKLRSVGGGLITNIVLGYLAPLHLKLHVSRGIDSHGETQVLLGM